MDLSAKAIDLLQQLQQYLHQIHTRSDIVKAIPKGSIVIYEGDEIKSLTNYSNPILGLISLKRIGIDKTDLKTQEDGDLQILLKGQKYDKQGKLVSSESPHSIYRYFELEKDVHLRSSEGFAYLHLNNGEPITKEGIPQIEYFRDKEEASSEEYQPLILPQGTLIQTLSSLAVPFNKVDEAFAAIDMECYASSGGVKIYAQST